MILHGMESDTGNISANESSAHAPPAWKPHVPYSARAVCRSRGQTTAVLPAPIEAEYSIGVPPKPGAAKPAAGAFRT
eukprot:CAMPEP_0172941142 /NCGR_PEP_ID=MMETSP1075-20121228/224394_1 /TAXON_ID=2916 /ORGANISM="Ceratium fusus, Strain PA161109" /LENGTH=76 /DNA_ID=CAMNT_0013802553 /DNA_START=924 /DNA_END=1150 /DNA_ORIENTATION=-